MLLKAVSEQCFSYLMWIISDSYVYLVELVCYLAVAITELLLLASCFMLINTITRNATSDEVNSINC